MFAPETDEDVPEGHCAQLVWPMDICNLPAPQRVQLPDPADALYDPALQGVHALKLTAPAKLVVPGGHAELLDALTK